MLDGQSSGSGLRILAPSWTVTPLDLASQLCPLPTNSGSTDDRGRMLQYNVFDTEISVLGTETLAACAP